MDATYLREKKDYLEWLRYEMWKFLRGINGHSLRDLLRQRRVFEVDGGVEGKGYYVPVGEGFLFFVRGKDPAKEKRFTLYHEIGHTLEHILYPNFTYKVWDNGGMWNGYKHKDLRDGVEDLCEMFAWALESELRRKNLKTKEPPETEMSRYIFLS